LVTETGELTVVDEGNGQRIEGHGGACGDKGEHEDGVDYECPLGALPSAIGGIEQGSDTLEEDYDDDS